jgi:hypothetical protein
MDGPVSMFLQSQDNDGMMHAVIGIHTHYFKIEEAVDTAA